MELSAISISKEMMQMTNEELNTRLYEKMFEEQGTYRG